jgi:hypothetical protein
MGFRKHYVLKCHTCKRRQVIGGPKGGGLLPYLDTHPGWKSIELKTGWAMLCPACANRRRRYVHTLTEDGMVLCNPRDKEASHRAAMGDIVTTDDPKKITCKKCLSLVYKRAKDE